MSKIGLVGGVGWTSTIDYYGGLCRLAEAEHRAGGAAGAAPMPEMTIESLDLAQAIAALGREDDEASWEAFDRYHRDALDRLAAAGASFALIASNTPHHRLAAITRGLALPVIDLFAETARYAQVRGWRRLVILGTALTLGSAVLRAAFARVGIEAEAPSPADQARVVALLAALHGGHSNGARASLEAIVASCRATAPDAAIVFACTELPLLFAEERAGAELIVGGEPCLNPSAIHIRAAFVRWQGRL